jgi:hypothetical protein
LRVKTINDGIKDAGDRCLNTGTGSFISVEIWQERAFCNRFMTDAAANYGLGSLGTLTGDIRTGVLLRRNCRACGYF